MVAIEVSVELSKLPQEAVNSKAEFFLGREEHSGGVKKMKNERIPISMLRIEVDKKRDFGDDELKENQSYGKNQGIRRENSWIRLRF